MRLHRALLGLVLCLGLLVVGRPVAADWMFIAIGDQILRAPKAPSTTDPLVETTQIYYQEGMTVNGMVYAGDGLLYVCADSSIFRFDPISGGPFEVVNTTISDPRCGTVDVDGSLVVGSGDGGIWKLSQVAGMCLTDALIPTDPPIVDFCYPYGEPSPTWPMPIEITGSGSFGPATDVAYFYNSDFLSLIEATSGNPRGRGSSYQLLRSIWRAYESGFETGDDCDSFSPTKNTKVLLDDLSEAPRVALSGGEIYVADGSDLVLVDIPATASGPFPACVDEPAATPTACESFGNLDAASLAGDVGGTVYVGTGSKNKDAVLYVVSNCSKTPKLIFPKLDWDTTISGLAVVPGTVTATPSGDPDDPIELDGSHQYTLEATCGLGDTLEAGPKTLGMVLQYINSIPGAGDANTPSFNDIIGSPSAFPGYDGFPWMWDSDCDVIDPNIANYERHIISSYQRQSNLRIGASESVCDLSETDPNAADYCNSAYILLEFNVPFDPDLVPVDPIGGRRGGTLTYLAGAALEDTELAEFCGYQSPLLPFADAPGAVPVLTLLPTSIPVKFKLEALVPDDGICASGQPISNATVMISVARIEAEDGPGSCTGGDFEVIYPLIPNGAGSAGPPPLFDDPGQPSGNYHFNLYVNENDYCDGLYLITATFLTDNAVEQQTLFRVDADGDWVP